MRDLTVLFLHLLATVAPVVCENPAHESRGCTVVELEHAAEALTAPNRACADQRGLWRDALIAQTLVRPFLMIVIGKRPHRTPEVPLAEWHDSRQTLRLHGPDEPFGKRVRRIRLESGVGSRTGERR